jgi:hypothetical protein
MQNNEHGVKPKESQSSDDLRENRKKGKLSCGAQYCHRCHEECGVIVYAYILRDMATESGANESSLVGQPEPQDAQEFHDAG